MNRRLCALNPDSMVATTLPQFASLEWPSARGSNPCRIALPRPHAPSRQVYCRATGFGTPKKPTRKQEGVVDVVHVRDWGEISETGFDVGNLKAKGPIRRVLDNSKELPFINVVSNFLADAEGSGAIKSPAGGEDREIPPFERWAFREEHYEQYLVDILLVNIAMKRAVERVAVSDGSCTMLDPVGLKLYRGDAVARDLEQLRSTREIDVVDISEASSYARAYATLLDSIKDTEAVNAHVYMLAVTQLAMGNRIGSVCVEKLNLIGRNAASTYIDYETDKPPLAVLTEAVNELGDGMSEREKEAFFDALLVAASRCSVLVGSLARV